MECLYIRIWICGLAWSSDLWIGSRANVRLTRWRQGRIVRKPVNAHPGLKVNRIITFSSIQCFCWFVLSIWWLLKLKTEGQTIYRKTQIKIRLLSQSNDAQEMTPMTESFKQYNFFFISVYVIHKRTTKIQSAKDNVLLSYALFAEKTIWMFCAS